jgi:hypothetical protein
LLDKTIDNLFDEICMFYAIKYVFSFNFLPHFTQLARLHFLCVKFAKACGKNYSFYKHTGLKYLEYIDVLLFVVNPITAFFHNIIQTASNFEAVFWTDWK